jgi:hypothetical protein
MKNKIIIGLAIMISISAMGQDGKRHGDKQSRDERMKEYLQLTNEQYASIRKIDDQYRSKFKEVKKDSVDDHARHEQMKALHTQRNAEIDKVLSDEQQSKWKTYQAERKEHRRFGRDPQELKTKLSLSDEQVKQLTVIKEESKKQKDAIKSDQSLTKEQRQVKLKELRAQNENAYQKVLTADQLEKWKTLKAESKSKNKTSRKEHHGHR